MLLLLLADGGLDVVQPLQFHALAFGWRPVMVVDLPVILVLALQFLPLVLEFVEEVRFMMLLPDPHLLVDVAVEPELLHCLVAVEDLSMLGDPSLPDLLRCWRCLPWMFPSRLWRSLGQRGLRLLIHFFVSHPQY